MKSWLKKLESFLKYTALHPQWLSNRYHRHSRKMLATLDQATILEVGSGNSQLDSLIRPSNHLIKVDYPITNKRYSSTPDIFADAVKLPVKGECMDAALLLEVAEHIAHDEDSIKEIYRVLKPSGVFYFSVPFIYPMHDQPYDFRRYTIHGLNNLLLENGFTIEKTIQHGNSIVTALQLINLATLELCRKTLQRNTILGALLSISLYPLCLLVNLVACPCIPFNALNISCFGYFVIARKVHGD